MPQKNLFKILITLVVLSLALMSCDAAVEALNQEGLESIEDVQGALENFQTEEETQEPDETEEPEETEEMETEEPEETEESEEVTPTDTPIESAMLGCFKIDFMEKSVNEDGTVTWTYQVMEVDCEYDLSHWVLELPGCAMVESASPEPFEIVRPDPNTDLYGIKFETGAGFEMGTFEVVTTEDWEMDERTVAAKGPDVYYGEIAGPTCGEVWDDENWDNEYWDGEDRSDDDEYGDDMDDDYDEVYIPEGQYPPPGECKVWDVMMDAGQQSEPVPCDCSYLEPGTFMINHEGEILDCEIDDDNGDYDNDIDNDIDDDIDDDTSYEDLYIPEGQYPPPGECKLWDPTMDAGQQGSPIPCDCSYIEPGTVLINHEGEIVDCDN